MKKLIGILAVLMLSAMTVYAADAPSAAEHAKHHPAGAKEKMGAEPTSEMRAKMAEMHQMMADCLKSTKPMAECKQEMMKNCPMMKEGGHCPMMDEMHGMMKDHSAHGKGLKAEKDAAGVEQHQ